MVNDGQLASPFTVHEGIAFLDKNDLLDFVLINSLSRARMSVLVNDAEWPVTWQCSPTYTCKVIEIGVFFEADGYVALGISCVDVIRLVRNK